MRILIRGGRVVDPGQWDGVLDILIDRITSYNVCYTKLLRVK